VINSDPVKVAGSVPKKSRLFGASEAPIVIITEVWSEVRIDPPDTEISITPLVVEL